MKEKLLKIFIVISIAFFFFVFIYIEIGSPPQRAAELTPEVSETEIGRLVGKMKILNPEIHPLKSRKFAYQLAMMHKQHKFQPELLIAIAMQENSLAYSGISNSDIGMFQLNYYWQILKTGKKDLYTIEELNNNWQLNMELAVQHLMTCKHEAPQFKGIEWWTCYHSYKNDRGQRTKYQVYVRKYLDRIL